MAGQSNDETRTVVPSHRMAQRLIEGEACRRIMAGEAPQTLSEFAELLSTWFKDAHPKAPAMPASTVEQAIRDTWHHRRGMIGSEL